MRWYLIVVWVFFGRTASMRDLPQPGIEPMPPAVEAPSITAGPPGKSPCCGFDLHFLLSDIAHHFMCFLAICISS